MSETHKQQPFESLGTQLKSLRKKRQETLADVCGAVEIEPDTLQAIEQGAERPGEDILLLLISYFAAKEDVATKLWELAGYDHEELPVKNATNSILSQDVVSSSQSQVPATVYTDMVHVMVNNYGVVMEFMQRGMTDDQPLAVSRVGMSKEHAQSIIELLQKSLSEEKPKRLQSPKTHTKKDQK